MQSGSLRPRLTHAAQARLVRRHRRCVGIHRHWRHIPDRLSIVLVIWPILLAYPAKTTIRNTTPSKTWICPVAQILVENGLGTRHRSAENTRLLWRYVESRDRRSRWCQIVSRRYSLLLLLQIGIKGSHRFWGLKFLLLAANATKGRIFHTINRPFSPLLGTTLVRKSGRVVDDSLVLVISLTTRWCLRLHCLVGMIRISGILPRIHICPIEVTLITRFSGLLAVIAGLVRVILLLEHVKTSLTKGMIFKYPHRISKLVRPDRVDGWPLVASVCVGAHSVCRVIAFIWIVKYFSDSERAGKADPLCVDSTIGIVVLQKLLHVETVKEVQVVHG